MALLRMCGGGACAFSPGMAIIARAAAGTPGQLRLNPTPPTRIPMAMRTPLTDTLPAPTPPPAVDDERALVGKAARGDVRAFESLYRRHVGRVHGVIVRLGGGHGAPAEGLAQ